MKNISHDEQFIVYGIHFFTSCLSKHMPLYQISHYFSYILLYFFIDNYYIGHNLCHPNSSDVPFWQSYLTADWLESNTSTSDCRCHYKKKSRSPLSCWNKRNLQKPKLCYIHKTRHWCYSVRNRTLSKIRKIFKSFCRIWNSPPKAVHGISSDYGTIIYISRRHLQHLYLMFTWKLIEQLWEQSLE